MVFAEHTTTVFPIHLIYINLVEGPVLLLFVLSCCFHRAQNPSPPHLGTVHHVMSFGVRVGSFGPSQSVRVYTTSYEVTYKKVGHCKPIEFYFGH